MKADLHLHSIFSDGKYRPKELIKLAKKRKFRVIALTDHDSVSGMNEFSRACKKNNIIGISGVEFSSYFNRKEIHILGYNVDCKNKDLRLKLKLFKTKRRERALKIIAKLKDLGMNIKIGDIKVFSKKNLFGRMHAALALIKLGYVKSISEAFDKYLGNGKKGFVPKEYFAPEDAVALIKNASGIPVLAHCVSSKLKEKEIKKLLDLGIEGLEVYHPKHSNGHENWLNELSKTFNLLVTGGSDFHGFGKNDFDNFGRKYVTLSENDVLIKGRK